MNTVIVLTLKAILAMAAGKARLHHHTVAFFKMLDAFAHRNHFACRLMPGNARIIRGNFADAPVQIPVQIAAANADSANLHGDLTVTRIALLRHLAFF
jgi:hypothetical protein